MNVAKRYVHICTSGHRLSTVTNTHTHIHKMIRCDEIAQKQFRMIYYRIECLRCLFSRSILWPFFFKKSEVFFSFFLYEYMGMEQKRLSVDVSVHLLVCACLSMYSYSNPQHIQYMHVLCMHASHCFGDFIQLFHSLFLSHFESSIQREIGSSKKQTIIVRRKKPEDEIEGQQKMRTN